MRFIMVMRSLLAAQWEADFQLHQAVPVTGQQHDEGEFVAEDAKTAVDNVATAATDVTGHLIDDARPVRCRWPLRPGSES